MHAAGADIVLDMLAELQGAARERLELAYAPKSKGPLRSALRKFGRFWLPHDARARCCLSTGFHNTNITQIIKTVLTSAACGLRISQHRPADSTPRLTHSISASQSKIPDAAAEHRQPFPALTTASPVCWEPCARQTNNNHEICECPRVQRVLCSIGSLVGSGEAATAHLSASETRVELEEVGVGSDLGQVPLHGALGVSRGVVLLYCRQHTLRKVQRAQRSFRLKSPNLRAHVHSLPRALGCSAFSALRASQRYADRMLACAH